MERRWWMLYLTWVISLSGFFLSVYFGEVLKLEPCRLCWYQRMALFPIVILLGVSLYRSDYTTIVYASVFGFIGLCISSYHALQEAFPLLQTTALCGASAGCSESAVLLFGYLSLPMLSVLGFVSILLLLNLGKKMKADAN